MSVAGWHPDPLHRYELRYHDGARWTEHVARGGRVGVDPLPKVRERTGWRARLPEWPAWWWATLIAFAVIAVAGILAGDLEDGPRTVDRSDAWFACEEFVKRNLKAPATADFPRYDPGRVHALGETRYVVDAFVDSENGFGANIRTSYDCTVTYDPSTDNWTLVDLETSP